MKRRRGLRGKDAPGYRHGHNLVNRESATHRSWAHMIERTTNPHHVAFARYGGANPPVKVCKRWCGEHGFENFLADMGKRPSGTSLSRHLNLGDYRPGNVEWGTRSQQSAEVKGHTAVLAWRNRKPIGARTLRDWKHELLAA